MCVCAAGSGYSHHTRRTDKKNRSIDCSMIFVQKALMFRICLLSVSIILNCCGLIIQIVFPILLLDHNIVEIHTFEIRLR